MEVGAFNGHLNIWQHSKKSLEFRLKPLRFEKHNSSLKRYLVTVMGPLECLPNSSYLANVWIIGMYLPGLGLCVLFLIVIKCWVEPSGSYL